MCLGTIGRVMRVWDADGVPMALVGAGQAEQEACLVYAPEVGVGAMVLVHLGFVVEELDPAEAADLLALRASSTPPVGGDGGAAPQDEEGAR